MGYCTGEQRHSIAGIRREEALGCYRELGVSAKNLIWLGYPDCRLNEYRGRRPAQDDDRSGVGGFIGLQNSFTHSLREIRPTQCFLPTCNDLHPDHRIVYDEFMISLFHSAGNIWPELGEPLEKVPYVHTYAVYCDFAWPPTLRMRTPTVYLEKKLKAIGAFKSQRQISTLIENVRHCGPEEYTRAIDFKLYHPAKYRNMFEEKKPIRML